MTPQAKKIYAKVMEEWNRQANAYLETHSDSNEANSLFRFKVLAAIVAQDLSNNNSLEVLTFGTGTKSIIDQTLAESRDGSVILDSHAEVIARRAFKRLLICEFKSFQDDPSKKIGQILERKRPHFPNYLSLRVRSHLKLHLFISRAPCGSAQKPANSKNSDSLRTFTWDSEKDPVATAATRTDNRQFYTCYDKLTMWSVVGLQGALLSDNIKPIYLDSVTVRSESTGEALTLEQNSLERALTGRISTKISLKCRGLRRNVPRSYCISKSDETFYADFTGKRSDDSSLSHNWIQSEGWEFVNSQNGKVHVSNDPNANPEEKVPSRLSKKFLLNEIKGSGYYYYQKSYYDLKQEAFKYQKRKKSVINACQSLDLGYWVTRNAQFENFHPSSHSNPAQLTEVESTP